MSTFGSLSVPFRTSDRFRANRVAKLTIATRTGNARAMPVGPVDEIAVLAAHRPAWLAGPVGGVRWCTGAAELDVLARGGRLRTAVVDSGHGEVDLDLVARLAERCPVLVVAPTRARSRWEAVGAAVVAELPSSAGAIDAAARRAAGPVAPTPGLPSAPALAPVIAVLAAEGASAAAAARAVALAIAKEGGGRGPIVLADLALGAPQRALHGIDDAAPGLPELVAAGRFGAPPHDLVTAAVHPTRRGYGIVAGLRRHHDWVGVGSRSAQAALEALRAAAGTVVAQVDADLEGEAETGSIDIEDRNVLARTTVGAARLVVVAGGFRQADRVALTGTVAALQAYGVDPARVVVVRSPAVGPLRPTRRLARALRRQLSAACDPADASRSGSDGHEPERIAPGPLGHWRQEIDGWITPSVPQQP